MNSKTAVQPTIEGIAPSRSWLRTRFIGLVAVFALAIAATFAATSQANAGWILQSDWSYGSFAWSAPGGTCREFLYESLDYSEGSNEIYRSYAVQTQGYSGTPHCTQVAAKAWIQGSYWISTAWTVSSAGTAIATVAMGYPVSVQGQYQAEYGGWTTYFAWSTQLFVY